MSMFQRRISPEMLEAIRRDYCDLTKSVAAVAAIYGMTKSQIQRLREQCGWPYRRAPKSSVRVESALLPPIAADTSPETALRLPETDPKALAAGIRRVVAHRLLRQEQDAAAGRAVDPEKAARASAADIRSLTALDRLSGGGAQDSVAYDDAPPPRSLNELRDELRRHLQRIRRAASTSGPSPWPSSTSRAGCATSALSPSLRTR